jgi:Ras-related protein Rab-1A
MTEETKLFRFTDPISKEFVTLRIKKSLIKQNAGSLSSITYLYKDHALILHIDNNLDLRAVNASVFLDNETPKSENFDIDELQVEEENIIEPREEERGEIAEISKEKILESLSENLDDEKLSKKLNILVTGPPEVGKTSLIYRFLYDFYEKSYIISKDVKKFEHDIETLVGKKLDVVFWDIPGQIDPSILTDELKGYIQGIICLFDVSNEQSFIDVKEIWIPYLKEAFKSHSVIYIANKIDLGAKREIFKDEIEKLRKEQNINLFESSVSGDVNLDGPINDLIFSVYLKHK